MQHIKNFIRTIKWKAIEYGIVAAVAVAITAYAYQPFASTYHKITEALSHTTEYAIASSTPSDKEERIEELKQGKEAQRILSIWAEKTWIAEQEAALEATKEKLRGEELDF